MEYLNEAQILNANLPIEEHQRALKELRARNQQVKEDKGHKRHRSAKGKRQRGITMDNRTYHTLGLVTDILNTSTSGTIIDKLFNHNPSVRAEALRFLNDFCAPDGALQKYFFYDRVTNTFEFDAGEKSPEELNAESPYNYFG